jgi:hypothetical protein
MTGTYGSSGKPTGAALATSDDFDVTQITTSYVLYTFNFSGANQYVMTADTHYCIEIQAPTSGTINSTNMVSVGVDSTSPTHNGNATYYWFSAWQAKDNNDTCFYVYGDPTVTNVLVTDTITLNDSVVCNKSLTLADSMTLNDSIIRNKILLISDAITLDDTTLLNKVLQLTDVIDLHDTILVNKTLTLVDTINLVDSLVRNKFYILYDTITLNDVARTPSKFIKLTDTIKLWEALWLSQEIIPTVKYSTELIRSALTYAAQTRREKVPLGTFLSEPLFPDAIRSTFYLRVRESIYGGASKASKVIPENYKRSPVYSVLNMTLHDVFNFGYNQRLIDYYDKLLVKVLSIS